MPGAEEDAAIEALLEETSEPRFACPCCGNLTLAGEPPGTFLLCEVCWWEDDPIQFDRPDYVGGANAPSLEQAREFFKSIGVSDPQLKGQERAPRREELPAGQISFPAMD